jgi:SAM-dependent methyltransferase
VTAAEERLANDPTSELWGEHRSRYRFAAQWAAGQRVLDIASGAGFGLAMLRAAGACPIGMDYDAAALIEARRVDPAASLACSDAARLPLPDASIDLVASFETIEHVPDARAMVRELRRVLRPGGRLVLSTPNRAFGPPSNNPFHIQEFTAPELHELLSEAFDDVRIHGQLPAARYRFVPFLMIAADYHPAALAWKVLNRLPFPVKDRIARLVSGQPFYPGEADYRFEPDHVDGAHALLAVAR